MLQAGQTADGSAAALVLKAAEPWSPKTHSLFPAAARARAIQMLRVGFKVSRKHETETEGVLHVWVDNVIKHLVSRG